MSVVVFYTIVAAIVFIFPLNTYLFTALSLDGAGKLPTGYAVIEGHPNLK